MPLFRLQTEQFDAGYEVNQFIARQSESGAVVTFTGVVRSNPADPLEVMTIECYPELAEAEIPALIKEAIGRFSLDDAFVIHRHGPMAPGEPIMQVMTASPHRHHAFEGADFLMDYLKSTAPFWKREKLLSGTRWVDAKSSDDEALERWTSP